MLYVIKNGSIEIGDEKKLEDKNYFFRLHSNVEWVDIIDYDKTDIVPLVKDILNRQHQFIEIKYLKVLMILVFLVFWTVVANLVLKINEKPPNFLAEKNEILQELKKFSKFTEWQNWQFIPTIPNWMESVKPVNMEEQKTIKK